jgi:pyruvate/2-oxoglutarate dehydrogenase complex dihydrolipoamide acyltransferase (E2) component
MNFTWVQIKPERKHRRKYRPGDIVPVVDNELDAFGDKFRSAQQVDATEEATELMWRFQLKAQQVEGTGKDGRIVKADVAALLPEGALEDEA